MPTKLPEHSKKHLGVNLETGTETLQRHILGQLEIWRVVGLGFGFTFSQLGESWSNALSFTLTEASDQSDYDTFLVLAPGPNGRALKSPSDMK